VDQCLDEVSIPVAEHAKLLPLDLGKVNRDSQVVPAGSVPSSGMMNVPCCGGAATAGAEATAPKPARHEANATAPPRIRRPRGM